MTQAPIAENLCSATMQFGGQLPGVYIAAEDLREILEALRKAGIPPYKDGENNMLGFLEDLLEEAMTEDKDDVFHELPAWIVVVALAKAQREERTLRLFSEICEN